MKLTSGDSSWRDLTALRYHYETQPLPTPLAWYFHQLPPAFHRVSAGITFLVGAGVARFQTIGTPVALTSIAFVIGILLLPFGEETRGKPLPS